MYSKNSRYSIVHLNYDSDVLAMLALEIRGYKETSEFFNLSLLENCFLVPFVPHLSKRGSTPPPLLDLLNPPLPIFSHAIMCKLYMVFVQTASHQICPGPLA